MTLPSIVWLVVPPLSGLIALGVLWIMGRAGATRPRRPDPQDTTKGSGAAHFLLRDGRLVDHDQAVGLLPPDLSDWAELREWLAFRFPDFPRSFDAVAGTGPVRLAAVQSDDPATLTLHRQGDLCHITLDDPGAPAAGERHDRLRLKAQMRNLNAALRHAPFGLCMSNVDGTTLWENKMFGDLPAAARARLLPDPETITPGQAPVTDRVPLPGRDGAQDQWYDISTMRIGDDLLHYTNDVSKVIRAETVRREFVQTLTKIFANLTTGLAVFNREKRLALFNPALIDLTGLSAEFLSARPTLVNVFDTLRDRQVMPEPKDYAIWRKQLGDMVASASDGHFEDTWALPAGVTYRVTGRPHPDGAIAFLFEDISDEITLTRRFRAQLDLRQSVLDHLSEGVAVLSANNMLLTRNARFTELMDLDPDTSPVEVPAADLLEICQTRLPDTTFWAEARKRVAHRDLRTPLDAVLERPGAGALRTRIVPLAGGATMLTLTPVQSAQTGLYRIRKAAV